MVTQFTSSQRRSPLEFMDGLGYTPIIEPAKPLARRRGSALGSLGVVRVMKILTHTFVGATILAALCLVGCSHRNALIGTWSTPQSYTLDFQKDGSLRVTNLPANNKALRGLSKLDGKWRMIDSSHIATEVVTPTATDSATYWFSISGNELKVRRKGAGNQDVRIEDDFIQVVEKLRPLTEDEKRLVLSAKKTNSSERPLSITDYYDDGSINLVRNREKLLIEKFNYSPPLITE